MIDAFMEFIQSNPVAMMLIGAHFVPYAIFAWAVLVSRLVCRRFSRWEWVVLGLFVLALLLEYLQLAVDGFNFSGQDTFGLPRYFGCFAPLLWIWLAKGLIDLWDCSRRRGLRLFLRGVVVSSLVWLTFCVYIRELRGLYVDSAPRDVMIAAQKIAPFIKADYRGPRRQSLRRQSPQEYFSTRRPVVFSDMAAAAWCVRGQSEGANMKGCPYLDDYLFIRVGSGYRDIETVDAQQYDYVGAVRGDGTLWRLFRRKGVPHAEL